MSRGNRKQPPGARRRIQGIDVVAPPAGMVTMIGLRYTEGGAFPDHLLQVSSASYSLGSPAVSGLQQVALLSYSLGSPAIPSGFRRIVVLP
jgi:hypothetical protein